MKQILIFSAFVLFENVCSVEAKSKVTDLYSGLYVGTGVSFTCTTNKSDITWTNFIRKPSRIQGGRVNKTGGSLLIGHGQCLSNSWYVGGELTTDISGDKSYEGRYGSIRHIRYSGKTYGCIPSAVVRVGYCLTPFTMPYIRCGIAYVKSKFTEGFGEVVFGRVTGRGQPCLYYGSDVNISKFAPVIGFGVESKIYNKFGLRLEGDYRLHSKKNGIERIITRLEDRMIGLRNRISGFTVRAVGTYTF